MTRNFVFAESTTSDDASSRPAPQPRRAASARLKILLLCLTLSFAIAASPENWPKYRRDYSNTGHSAEKGTLANGVTTVSSSNISSLYLKWSRYLGGAISGTPAIVGGVVYIGAYNGVVYALNAVTGGIIWSHNICGCRIASSPMVLNGIVYIGAANAKLYALNASTGATVWSTLLTSQAGADIWSSPVVFNGQVYVGIASHDDAPCVKGAVYAVNASSGAITWKFNTLDQTSCPSGSCVGAAVWTSAAVDTVSGLVYFGTGNPGASCSPATANVTRYPDSIIALKAGSPTLMGWFQTTANDTLDHDFGASPVLLSTGTNGSCLATTAAQRWVAEANKNGSVYFVPRGSAGIGSLAKTIAVGSWPIASPAVQAFCTSSGVSNNLYQPTPAGNFVGINQSATGSLSKRFTRFVSGSKLFSAPLMVNDLLFFGSGDFKLHAATKGGTLLWSFTTGGSVNSGPSQSNGRIYFGSNDGHLYCLSVNAK